MYKLRFLLCIAAMLFFSLALCSITQAAAARTYVSVTGADSNPCTYASPCRLFQHAHDVVADGGEVIALTSGAYGTLSITKNVTISGVGVSAVVSPYSFEDGVAIATPGITVVLRSIDIRASGAATGGNGINVTSVGNLHVENCIVSGFIGHGIYVNLAADGSYIFIKDTIVRNNSTHGIYITTNSGIVRASIDNCRSERNGGKGFWAYNNSRVTINRSVASGNGQAGFEITGFGAAAELNCEECVSSNNADGFDVGAGAAGGVGTIRVSHSTATNNTGFGFSNTGGTFESKGNNTVRGNGTQSTGAISPLPGL